MTVTPETDDQPTLPPIEETTELPEFIQLALQNAGWTSLTPVQAASLPYSLQRQDMMVQAKTGSGKTGAFILPLIECIDPIEDACQALVLVPTRELALQVVKEAEMLMDDMSINIVPIYGGVPYEKQLRAFRKGAHLIVGTPGRVIDHLQQGNLDLGYLHTLLFDEADRMLSMGFYQDMLAIKSYLPDTPRHSCMFSATFPVTVRSLAHQFLNDAAFLNLSTDSIHVEEVAHVAYQVSPMEKDKALIRLLEVENPAAAIIFCNTRQRVNYVAVVLQRYGYDADQLTSDLSQNQRERVLDRIRNKQLRFLVATDVAARGIDIPHLSHSIQFELPEDLEVYIHRAGRTGRAGAGGTAFSIVAGLDELQLYKLAKQYDIDFDMRPAPTAEMVSDAISGRLLELLRASYENRDRLAAERSQRFHHFVSTLADNDEALQMVALLIDDFYQSDIEGNDQSGGEDSESTLVKKPIKKNKKRKGRKKSRRDQ